MGKTLFETREYATNHGAVPGRLRPLGAAMNLPPLHQVAALMGGTGACSANAVLFPRKPVRR